MAIEDGPFPHQFNQFRAIVRTRFRLFACSGKPPQDPLEQDPLEEEYVVLHKCANPVCLNPFRRLSEGKLFLLETEALDPSNPERLRAKGKPPRHIEHYWLCDQCATMLTLSFERGRGMITVPLPKVPGKMPVSGVHLGDLTSDVSSRNEQSAAKGA